MRKSLLKLHSILWLVTLLAICIDLTRKQHTVDFNIQDTYFVTAKIHVYLGIVIYFGIVTFLYWLLHKARKETSRLLDRLYIIFMLIGIVAIVSMPFLSQEDIYSKNPNTLYYTSASILIALAQLILIVNFISTLFKKEASKLSP